MNKLFEEQLNEISNTLKSLNDEKFNQLIEESVTALKKGKKIIVSGLGKNVPICDKFVGTMLSLGLDANFLHTNSAVHGDIGMVKKDDLVIILTKSGETVESINLVEHLLSRMCNLWLLSFSESSTLTKRIDKSLIVNLEKEGDPWNIMPNNSTTVNLIILQTLAMSIANEMRLSLNDFKINHPGGAIGAKLNG